MTFFWDDPVNSLVVLLIHFIPALAPIVPGLAMAFWARRRITSVKVSSDESPMAGAEAARAILGTVVATSIVVIPATGPLANFYDPARKELRLAEDVYAGRSARALGIVAHEAGHALQDAQGYWPVRLRFPVIYAAKLGGGVAWLTLLAGVLMVNPGLCFRGTMLYSGSVIALLALQRIERDANRRSRETLPLAGLEELPNSMAGPFQTAFEAAPWTEIAATLPRFPRRIVSPPQKP